MPAGNDVFFSSCANPGQFKLWLQMYKIYINDNPLFLIHRDDLPGLQEQFPDCLAGRYTGQMKTLLHYVDHLEKATQPKAVVLYCGDPDEIMRDFQSLFFCLEAAGGLVFNPEGQALFIFRRGRWDLPKGKLDPGETPQEAAVREVKEETGLQQVTLRRPLHQTYHTYREKGKRLLKLTYWYEMETADQKLIPQTEEDIEKAVWIEMNEAFLGQPDMFQSIRDVVQAYFSK